ncbi:MAG: tRNA (adenosine(37)-N6)-dimethylallyltransferase MiaA [Ignavibacteria bacterium]
MKKALAIVGPTASGKTKLSIEISKLLDGEIISADSRQIYKNIPIATSHPAEEDLKSIKHYFINELELNEYFSAGQFGKKGRSIVKEIFSKNKTPLIIGGSGLYVRSLIDGFFEDEIESKHIREELYKELEIHGEDHLYDELEKTDPETFSKIPKRKIRRVIRALEIYLASGKKLSEFHNTNIDVEFETIQIALMHDRKDLYNSINERVDEMIEAGLIDEIKSLKEKGYHYKTHNSLNTVGIKEVFKFFDGELDLETMISLIKQNTRRYAKRQLTWFRKDKRINWIEVNECNDVTKLAETALKIFNSGV